MKDRILSALNFFRLVDENGLLSLTNICVVVIIVKLAMAQQIDFAAVAGLFGALSGYSYKRWVNKDRGGKPLSEMRLKELGEKVDRISMAVGLKR